DLDVRQWPKVVPHEGVNYFPRQPSIHRPDPGKRHRGNSELLVIRDEPLKARFHPLQAGGLFPVVLDREVEYPRLSLPVGQDLAWLQPRVLAHLLVSLEHLREAAAEL